MLIYHPAFDIYHGIFRLLRILSLAPRQKFEIERIRILDFYVLFPSELPRYTFPGRSRPGRKQFKAENPYQSIADPKRIFFRLEPVSNLCDKMPRCAPIHRTKSVFRRENCSQRKAAAGRIKDRRRKSERWVVCANENISRLAIDD